LRADCDVRLVYLLDDHGAAAVLQELLGYTAFTAGLVVGPRGIGSILGMPVIGYLGNKVDPRYLADGRVCGFGIMSLYFGNINLGISPWTLLVPIVVTGFALSFVFVPIATQTYSTLRNDQIGNASGIFNLLRNIGGSIGISIAQTLLVRRSAVHQSEIGGAVSQTQYWFEQQVSGLTGYLTQHTAAPNARHAAGVDNVSATRAAVAAVGVCGCVSVDVIDVLCVRGGGVVLPQGSARKAAGWSALKAAGSQ